MFDRHFHETKVAAAYPQSVTVTENRAPTDESVKLLREMEAEARKSIVDTFVMDGNLLEGAVVTMGGNPRKHTVFVRFNLNGKEYISETKVDAMSLDMAGNQVERTRLLLKKVSEAIFDELLRKIVTEIAKK